MFNEVSILEVNKHIKNKDIFVDLLNFLIKKIKNDVSGNEMWLRRYVFFIKNALPSIFLHHQNGLLSGEIIFNELTNLDSLISIYNKNSDYPEEKDNLHSYLYNLAGIDLNKSSQYESVYEHHGWLAIYLMKYKNELIDFFDKNKLTTSLIQKSEISNLNVNQIEYDCRKVNSI